MLNVLISGGSGFVGKHLSKKLSEKGYHVSILTRKKRPSFKYVQWIWDLNEEYIEKGAIESAHYIIHLAGENISERRWTKKRKREIIDSRTKTAALIYKKVQKENKNLKAFISASAVGYYGAITTDKIFEESDNAANDFIGKVCQAWETSADQFTNLGIRTVKIRTSVVLAANEGALKKMIFPTKLGLGSPIGNGKQYLPWIHINDLCEIYIKAIEDPGMTGPVNAVAPEFTNNKEFMKTLAEVLDKPFWFPSIPKFFMKIIFGEMACILNEGSRISSKKIVKNGFIFRHATLKKTLMSIFSDL
jgi:uncharacterized protein